jgi:ankyrin repeat protein
MKEIGACIIAGDVKGLSELGIRPGSVDDRLLYTSGVPHRPGLRQIPLVETPTPLAYAICCGNFEIVRYLVQLWANVVLDEENWHPIHYAAAVNSFEILNFLLNCAPAEVNAKTRDQKATPLHFSVTANDPRSVALLLSRGADVNHPNTNGETPLHMAATLPDTDIAELLLAYGASRDPLDTSGLSPLAIAKQNRNDPFLALLANPSSIPNPARILEPYDLPTPECIHIDTPLSFPKDDSTKAHV